MKNYMVSFKYADSLSGWEWRYQKGIFCGSTPEVALLKCKQVYGLGVDCEYEIIEVKEI